LSWLKTLCSHRIRRQKDFPKVCTYEQTGRSQRINFFRWTSKSTGFQFCALGMVSLMADEAILREADNLRNIGSRLETLAEQHSFGSEALTTAAASVRNTATLLEVLVAIRSSKTNLAT
jgi:hypothetical protein